LAKRMRPSGEGGATGWERKKKEVGRGWAERPDGPAGRWTDWGEIEGKILFEIKI
jgi:hypothetical protein